MEVNAREDHETRAGVNSNRRRGDTSGVVSPENLEAWFPSRQNLHEGQSTQGPRN